jgi:hypothetical protein
VSSRRIEVGGQRFGRAVVIRCVGTDHKHIMWECKCDCGKTFITRGSSLAYGNTKSCGCLQSEAVSNMLVVHGQAKRGHLSGTFRSYKNARARCRNPKNKHYRDYGGRGIKFQFSSFEEFFKELGPRPIGKTVDRINTNGHYQKGNVRWATAKEQANNKRGKCA